MNKTMKMWMLTAILICGVSLIGCGEKKQPKNETKVEKVKENKTFDAAACDAAVDDYLVNVIGKQYAKGEFCITSPFVISTDTGNLDDVLVWGDFWVFNYNLSGDTLKTVSGGNHPGLMHLKKTDKGFEVTNFEVVADGADNQESAKKIFGNNYDAFQEINGNPEKRDDIRAHFVADYVKKNNLSATMLQDYGWPAIVLPQAEK